MKQFYDERSANQKYLARYIPLYAAVLPLIRWGSRVVELGSGNGRMAAILLASEIPSSYLGLDFAPETVKRAKLLVGDVFRVGDLTTCDIPDADVYVTLEVLEHLDDDLGLLSRLPARRTVVLSVPSFDSASHVRHFPQAHSALRRYESVLDIDHDQAVPVPGKRAFFHLLRGIVR